MRRAAPLLVLAAALAGSGCGAADAVLDRIGTDEDVGTPTVSIGVLAPLSGGQARAGTSVLTAVEQAVADSGGVPGWDVQVTPVDLATDDLDNAVEQLTDDPTMIAVVTGFTADDVRVVVPELNEARLTVLSPADSDPRHVTGADPRAPLRPWAGYVTVAVEPDPAQTALADHLVRLVGAQRVVIVVDASADAATAAMAVERSLTQRGVTEVTTHRWSGSTPSDDLAAALEGLEPGDALVVAGSAQAAAQVAGLRGDGVTLALAAQPEDLTGEQAALLDGAVAPLPGADPRRGADQLAAALETAQRPTTVVDVAPAAYDGARLLVDAASRCLPPAENPGALSRSACRAEVAGATWSGITGPIQFDEYGARLGLLPGVVTLRSGTWQPPGV